MNPSTRELITIRIADLVECFKPFHKGNVDATAGSSILALFWAAIGDSPTSKEFSKMLGEKSAATVNMG